jgi:hypothetical protein
MSVDNAARPGWRRSRSGAGIFLKRGVTVLKASVKVF